MPERNVHSAATGGDYGTVHGWHTGTGTLPHRALGGHPGPVWGIAFGRGGLLATAGRDGTARLWDVRTGQPVGERLTGHEDALTHLAFSPSGDLLATASDDGTARLWPLTARTP